MKRLLLIEDDAWLADSYAHILSDAGYEVQTVKDGYEAIRLIESAPPDGIVADVLLEGHTIINLLHELQSYDDTAVVPIILCSGLAHPSMELERLHHYGVRAVLDKATVTPEKLIETVEEALA